MLPNNQYVTQAKQEQEMRSHLKGVFDVDNIALMMKAENNVSVTFFSSLKKVLKLGRKSEFDTKDVLEQRKFFCFYAQFGFKLKQRGIKLLYLVI